MENNSIIIPPATERYDLKKKFEIEEELKIYFMGLVPNPLQISTAFIKNKNIGIVAYNYHAATKKAMEVWGSNGQYAISSNEEDFALIKDILRKVSDERIVIQNMVPADEKPKKMGIENFKNSLLLASEEYIKDEVDKAVLKKIISTL